MTEPKLDALVKGTPPSELGAGITRPDLLRTSPDPTALLPSSPAQIFLNLLIMESSLRAQYLTLLARRRQHAFTLTVLTLWIAYFFWCQWLRPREDGTGVGGSVYWVVDAAEKVALIGGIVMALLFWVTGQWERGVRWPRRWLAVTNRGLRGFNCKLVILRGPWWRETLSQFAFLVPYYFFYPTPGSDYQRVEYVAGDRKAAAHMHARHRSTSGIEVAEEDIAQGGDYVKLLLLPKPFTPEFRENWEQFREDYWEKENERRADLRKRVRARQREIARQEGGWFWWTGWRGWARASRKLGTGGKPVAEPEKMHHHHHPRAAPPLTEKRRRRPSTLRDHDGSHSRSSSRSSTSMSPEMDEPGAHLGPRGSIGDRERRWSSSSAAGADRRRRKGTSLSTMDYASGGLRPPRLAPSGSRPGTPTAGSGESAPGTQSLHKRASTLSVGSDGSDAVSVGSEGTVGAPRPVPSRPAEDTEA